MAKNFVGEPKTTDFQLKEEKLPSLQDGGLFMTVVGFGGRGLGIVIESARHVKLS